MLALFFLLYLWYRYCLNGFYDSPCHDKPLLIWCPRLIRSEVSRMKILFFDFDTFQIWFVVMICLWLGFAVMILIWFQLWFWYGFSYDSWCGSNLWFEANPSEPYPKYSKIVSKPYQNRIKTVSKSYQKRIKIVSKSYQNHKNLRQIDQKPVPGLFLFLFLKPTHWNHIKIISKSYQNHIKIIPQP